jgi:hypothetical protein
MNSTWTQLKVSYGLFLFLLCALLFVLPQTASAINILEYSNLITDSAPNAEANHTISFILNTSISPGSEIEITPPLGFTVVSASTFAERNVELWVDGSARVSGTSSSPGVDLVEITTGSPGFFRYTLNPSTGINTGSQLKLRIGNHTSTAIQPITSYSSSTGTTTTPGDVRPIINSATLGRHDVGIEIYDGGLVADAKPIIFLNERVSMPSIDTTETIPPFRFNPSPTSTVGGTTLNVEISLETDEFSICRYDTVAGTAFGSMPNTFTNTGFIFHSGVVAVTPNSVQQFYVRCLDDEGNFNIDDFLITFSVNDVPTGESNTEGSEDGDGTGSGNEGTGDGSGAGGTTGQSSGEEPNEGGTTGNGGSGGGGGGGTGGRTGSTAGGGFESTDAPFRSGDGRVIISGTAYPNSTVGILVDGNFFETTRSNSIGVYSITLDEIARGAYTFGIYAEDSDDIRSSTFSTSFTVTGARTSALGNINIAPSIKVEPDPVNPGEALTISGYAIPDSEITIENGKINGSVSQILTAQAGSNGRWSVSPDTSGYTVSTYQVRAKAAQEGGDFTNFSEYTFYGVGQSADVPIDADLNRDGKVNLIDFSILLFWWNSNGGDSDPPADINRDGDVSLTDFSILLFNWTG